MAKGCCGGASCACRIVGPEEGRLTVTGSGQPNDPFVLDVDVHVISGHNNTFDTTVTGDGSEDDPWAIQTSFAPTAKLDDLPDVNVPGPSNGQVLSWNAGTSRWVAAAPTTAAAGSVNHDTSMSGDGSVGAPLGVSPLTARLFGTFSTGVGLTDQGMLSVVQHFADSIARSAGLPVPNINQLTMLDTNPGVVDYWDGSKWTPLQSQVSWALDAAFLPISGPYTPGSPVQIKTVQLNTTTDSGGKFDVLGAADLTGRAGVLYVQLQETGATGWKAMLHAESSKVTGTAYRLTDGSVMSAQPITATVVAFTY